MVSYFLRQSRVQYKLIVNDSREKVYHLSVSLLLESSIDETTRQFDIFTFRASEIQMITAIFMNNEMFYIDD